MCASIQNKVPDFSGSKAIDTQIDMVTKFFQNQFCQSKVS